MTCTFDKEKLTAYYDGELEAGEKAQVEAHISACSACLRELGDIKSASVLVKTLSRPRAPQAVAAGVSREIAAAGRRARFDTARRAALWVTAAAAGLFVVANVLWFTAPERAPQPAPEMAKASRKAFEGGEAARDGRSRAAAPEAATPAAEPEMAKARQESREAELKKGAPAPVEKQADEALARLQQSELRGAAKDKAAESGPAAAPRPSAKSEVPPASPPAPEKAAGVKSEGLADAKAPAAKPAAPGAPPPPAAPAPAEGADRADARRLKEDSAPTAYVCESAGRPLAAARAAVEDYNTRRTAPDRKAVASAGGARGPSAFGQAAPPPPLTLDLTDAEIAELSKELEKQGLKLVPASPEQQKALSAPRVGAPSGNAEQDRLWKAAEEAPAAPAPADPAARRANTRRITIYFAAPEKK